MDENKQTINSVVTGNRKLSVRRAGPSRHWLVVEIEDENGKTMGITVNPTELRDAETEIGMHTRTGHFPVALPTVMGSVVESDSGKRFLLGNGGKWISQGAVTYTDRELATAHGPNFKIISDAGKMGSR